MLNRDGGNTYFQQGVRDASCGWIATWPGLPTEKQARKVLKSVVNQHSRHSPRRAMITQTYSLLSLNLKRLCPKCISET
jgi:hypothetical protein